MVPSWQITVVPEFCGTTTVVVFAGCAGTITVVSFAGGEGLLLLMQPDSIVAAIKTLDKTFIIASW